MPVPHVAAVDRAIRSGVQQVDQRSTTPVYCSPSHQHEQCGDQQQHTPGHVPERREGRFALAHVTIVATSPVTASVGQPSGIPSNDATSNAMATTTIP